MASLRNLYNTNKNLKNYKTKFKIKKLILKPKIMKDKLKESIQVDLKIQLS